MDFKKFALFIGHRFLMTIFLILVIPSVVFFLIEAAPGDFITAFLGASGDPEQMEQLREQFGVDDPLLTRYANWMTDTLIERDFGMSAQIRQPASDVYSERASATNELLYLALCISLIIGIPLGFLAALMHKALDILMRYAAMLLVALPIFWVAMVLLLNLGVNERMYPMGGRCPFGSDCALADRIDYLVMPLMSMVIFWASAVAFMTRNFIKDFVAVDDSRADSEASMIGAVLSVVATLPVIMAGMFSSLVLVETIFNWPGVGRLLLNAIFSLDYPIISVIIVMSALKVALVYFLSSLAYGILCMIFRVQPDGYAVNAQFPLQAIAEQQRSSPPESAVHIVASEMATPTAEVSETAEEAIAEGASENTEESIANDEAENAEESAAEAQPESTKQTDAVIPPVFGVVASGVAMLIFLIIVTLTSYPEILTDADPLEFSAADRFLPVGTEGHPLGTDSLGRDMLVRVLNGGANSLDMAVTAALISIGIGLFFGLIGGSIDGIPGHILNVPLNWLMLPFNIIPLLMLVLLVMVVAEPSKSAIIWTMGLLGWTNVTPMVRARLRHIRRRKLYQSSASDSELPLMERSVWHVVISPALMLLYFLLVNTVSFLLIETAISFLGVGIRPPEATWGTLFADVPQYLTISPDLVYVIGIPLALTIACLMIIAENIRRTFDFTA